MKQKKRYWLWGGIILAILGLFFPIPGGLITMILGNAIGCVFYIWSYVQQPSYCQIYFPIATYLFNTIICFIVGVGLGFLYEEIVNRIKS